VTAGAEAFQLAQCTQPSSPLVNTAARTLLVGYGQTLSYALIYFRCDRA
jgi:hypothetical protein